MGQRSVLVASIVVGVLTALVVLLLRPRLSASQATTFWIMTFMIPVVGLTGLTSSTLRSFRQIVRAQAPAQLLRPILVAVAAGTFFLLGGRGLPAPLTMVFALGAAAIAYGISYYWQRRALPASVRAAEPVLQRRMWLQASLPLLFMSGMQLVLSRADVLMLGAIQNTTDAGIYAVAARVSNFVSLGLVAANAIVAPLIGELYSTGQHRELQHVLALAARGILVFTVVVGGAFVAFGTEILGLFGSEFTLGYTPLLFLIAGQAVSSLVGSTGFLMSLTGHHVKAAQIVGLSVLLNIVLNAILISTMGMTGAAIATGTTMR